MRLLLKDSERRPDPAPVATDDRKAVLIGLGLWVLGLVALLAVLWPLGAKIPGWWLWTILVGIFLGLLGLIYTQRRRH